MAKQIRELVGMESSGIGITVSLREQTIYYSEIIYLGHQFSIRQHFSHNQISDAPRQPRLNIAVNVIRQNDRNYNYHESSSRYLSVITFEGTRPWFKPVIFRLEGQLSSRRSLASRPHIMPLAHIKKEGQKIRRQAI